ncbi:MAG: hypothetical protein JXR97_10375 [Planctomycetes bacterium]|nr:hypothetical protein [Planctomycetota bacterium]
MINHERMPSNRHGLPDNERRRLQLHFSTDMIDWCFAGLVAIGPEEKHQGIMQAWLLTVMI